MLSFTGYDEHLKAGDVIDYLTKGISSSMLARRWNSPELITLDLKAMEAILADENLLKSLEQIEMFRNISDDLTALISSNKELRTKKLAREKLTRGGKKAKTRRRRCAKESRRSFGASSRASRPSCTSRTTAKRRSMTSSPKWSRTL